MKLLKANRKFIAACILAMGYISMHVTLSPDNDNYTWNAPAQEQTF